MADDSVFAIELLRLRLRERCANGRGAECSRHESAWPWGDDECYRMWFWRNVVESHDKTSRDDELRQEAEAGNDWIQMILVWAGALLFCFGFWLIVVGLIRWAF